MDRQHEIQEEIKEVTSSIKELEKEKDFLQLEELKINTDLFFADWKELDDRLQTVDELIIQKQARIEVLLQYTQLSLFA